MGFRKPFITHHNAIERRGLVKILSASVQYVFCIKNDIGHLKVHWTRLMKNVHTNKKLETINL